MVGPARGRFSAATLRKCAARIAVASAAIGEHAGEIDVRVAGIVVRGGCVRMLESDVRVRAAESTRTHLDHLVPVARIAAREVPELGQKFVFTRPATAYLEFRTAARSMEAEAQARKEVLVRHGLSDTVLGSLEQALDQDPRGNGPGGRRDPFGGMRGAGESVRRSGK